MTIDELAKGVQEGKRRHLAKAITLVESNREADQQTAQELISKVRSAKETVRVGISGVPGVGKSTFIEALGNLLIEEGLKVAVLAVDPSSPATGGSILGDKTRMETLSSKDEAFIRPSPTSGTLGGVAKRTRESMMLCEAAGYDVILVETVGVGQSEFEVASMVDCFLVLMLPGAGDSLQGIKRGIMEIIDILVINKADGDQEKMAKNAVMEYQNAFHLLTPKYDGIGVEFLTVSSIKKKRIDEAWEKIQGFITQNTSTRQGFISALKEKEIFEAQRKEQELNWFKRLVEDEVLRRLWNSRENKKSVEDLISRIKSGKITPSKAAMELLSKI